MSSQIVQQIRLNGDAEAELWTQRQDIQAEGMHWIQLNVICGRILIGNATLGGMETSFPCLTSVWVDENYRRRGVARAMTSTAIELARRGEKTALLLMVGLKNQPAIDLYRSTGFYIAQQHGQQWMMMHPLRQGGG